MDNYFIHKFSKEIIDDWENIAGIAIEKHEKNFSTIPPNDSMEKEVLENSSPVFGWMKQCEFILTNDVSDLKDKLLSEAKEWDNLGTVKPLIALDLETTSLSNNWTCYGGKYGSINKIVGICIAVSDTKGYYVPVLHTEEDNYKNISIDESIELLNFLNKNFNIVYHNALFDVAVQMVNGVVIEKYSIVDTLYINKAMANDNEFFPININNGLKSLSKYVLKREMLEINELLGVKKGAHISFNSLPAKNAYVYGASDAVNTMGLFKAFVLEDRYGRNPYTHQKNIMKILRSSIYMTTSTVSYGLPIDYKALHNATHTMAMRMIVINDKFDKLLTKYDHEKIKITSPNVGNLIVEMIKSDWGDTSTMDEFFQYTKDKFSLVRKVTTLKNGTEKETFNTNDDVMGVILKNIDSVSFLQESTKSDVKMVIEMVSLYRSLNKDFGTMASIIHATFRDSRNINVTPVALRLYWTDTGRFASSKGTGREQFISFKELKTKTNAYVINGNGITTGLNSQGMPSTHHTNVKVKPYKGESEKFNLLKKQAETMVKQKVASLSTS